MSRRSGRAGPRWFVWDPAGIVIAVFAWVLVFGLLLAVLVSISQWVGLLSPMGITEGIWFSGLFFMCLWSHTVVLTSNPGTVPFKLKGLPPAGGEEEEDVEEVEEEMPLNEFEECEDDGSLFIYCDECEIYRPSRYVLSGIKRVELKLTLTDRRAITERRTATRVNGALCCKITTGAALRGGGCCFVLD
jgi:hypothetical protein